MREVWKNLSGVSQQTLIRFQNEFDSTKPYDEFVVAQNDIIRTCLELERADIGKIVRSELQLPEFPEDLYHRVMAAIGPGEDHVPE